MTSLSIGSTTFLFKSIRSRSNRFEQVGCCSTTVD